MGAIRDTLLGYKHQKTENLLKTLEDKVLKNEASEKDSALNIFPLNISLSCYIQESLQNAKSLAKCLD